MYKSADELRKNNSDIYAAIVRVFDKLHNHETGFMGLEHSLMKKLSPDERKKYKQENDTNIHFRLYKNRIIIGKINEFEKSGTKYNQEDFENAVLQELRVFAQNPKKYMDGHGLDDYDKVKFALTGEQIMKFRFYCSCGNAAAAFAYVNSTLPKEEQIPLDKLMFINSTHWKHLADGMSGHTIPCVKMADGNFYAMDPQKYHREEGVEIILSQVAVGNKICHLLKSQDMVNNQPYMITRITSPDEYSKKYRDFDKFIADCSIVPENAGKQFLESILSDVPSNEMKTYLKELEDIKYLSKQDRKTLLLKLGKGDLEKQNTDTVSNMPIKDIENEL